MRDYGFGTGKWVFIDWMGIDPGYGTQWSGKASSGYCVPRGVELRTHTPNVDPEFCIPLDQPWETGCTAYATFLEDQGVFRCWYEHLTSMAYAESDDGTHWTKPVLGQLDYAGSTANNLLANGMHGANVFIDPIAAPEERYKMVGCWWTEEEKAAVGGVSPDGLRWTHLPEPVLRHHHADTQSICLYDSDLGKYVLYTRQTDGRMQRRGINRALSDDFRRFASSVPIFESSPHDPPDWDLYCNGYSKWPGASAAHVMRLSVYEHTSDVVEICLATSRDGVIWHWPLGRTPWVTGGPSHPDPYSSVYACAGILQTGSGEWSTYLGAAHHAHNEPIENMTQPAGILAARMREDGFMSLSSTGLGEFWTVPFTLSSDTLRLNVKTRYSGFVRAELLECGQVDTGAETNEGEVVPGYSLADCVPITGDHVDGQLAWNVGAGLEAFRGRTVRLHFELCKADLYAIKFG
jgi:hypothetical protein